MGRETQAVVKRLSTLIRKNWDREYVETCRYVRASLSLSLSTSLLHLMGRAREKKGGDGESRGTTAANGTEMRRTDLRLKE